MFFQWIPNLPSSQGRVLKSVGELHLITGDGGVANTSVELKLSGVKLKANSLFLL